MTANKGLFSNLMNRLNVPPGPKGDLVLGVIRLMQNDPTSFLLETARQFPRLSHLRFAHKSAYLIDDPDLIEHVTKTNRSNYQKSPLYEVARDIIGDGICTSDGDRWKKRSAIVRKAFGDKTIANSFDVINSCVSQILQDLEKDVGSGTQSINFSKFAFDSSFFINVTLLFGEVSSFVDGGAKEAWDSVCAEIVNRWWNLTKLTNVIPTKKNLDFWKDRDHLQQFFLSSIRNMKANTESTFSFLQELIEARGPKGEKLEDAEIQEEGIGLLMAAQDSTAMAILWTLFCLSTNPQSKSKAQTEIDGFSEDSLVSYTAEQFPYLMKVVSESLRLYPPMWGLSRSNLKEDTFDKYPIAPDAIVIFSPYVTHRNPKYWTDPLRFDPERFSKEKTIDPFTYFPFGLGDRACMGSNLAMLEITIFLSRFLKKFDFQVERPEDVKLEARITIYPKTPLMMRVTRR